MMDCYTKISAEIQYYDGERTKFELHRNAWDLDGEQMGELFRQLMLAMGFTPNTVASVFGDDQETYQEAADLRCSEPCCEDSRDAEESCGHTLAKVFADNPCFYCEQVCEDTACLHDDDDSIGTGCMPEWHDGDGDVE